MAYNKARAEKKWLKWKEAEEKKLRELGVDEETIQRLHTYDWAEFNRERRYLQRQVEWSPYVDMISAQDLELPVEDVESLMDSIEDMELLRILSKEDKLTIQIAFLKMSGYQQIRSFGKTCLRELRLLLSKGDMEYPRAEANRLAMHQPAGMRAKGLQGLPQPQGRRTLFRYPESHSFPGSRPPGRNGSHLARSTCTLYWWRKRRNQSPCDRKQAP